MNFIKKNIVKLESLFVVILGFFISLAIGFYLNPFVVGVYGKAEIDIPDNVYKLVKYSGWELLGWWVLVGSIILIKDIFIKESFGGYINLVIFLTMLIGLFFYIENLEAFHWPVQGL